MKILKLYFKSSEMKKHKKLVKKGAKKPQNKEKQVKVHKNRIYF